VKYVKIFMKFVKKKLYKNISSCISSKNATGISYIFVKQNILILEPLKFLWNTLDKKTRPAVLM